MHSYSVRVLQPAKARAKLKRSALPCLSCPLSCVSTVVSPSLLTQRRLPSARGGRTRTTTATRDPSAVSTMDTGRDSASGEQIAAFARTQSNTLARSARSTTSALAAGESSSSYKSSSTTQAFSGSAAQQRVQALRTHLAPRGSAACRAPLTSRRPLAPPCRSVEGAPRLPRLLAARTAPQAPKQHRTPAELPVLQWVAAAATAAAERWAAARWPAAARTTR